jgi:hypothetical protein
VTAAEFIDPKTQAIELVVHGDVVREVSSRQKYVVEAVSYFESWDGFEIDRITCRDLNAPQQTADDALRRFKPAELERV